jgi:hypothetical protein
MTIVLANGASYDFKKCVVLRRLSLEMQDGGRKPDGRSMFESFDEQLDFDQIIAAQVPGPHRRIYEDLKVTAPGLLP